MGFQNVLAGGTPGGIGGIDINPEFRRALSLLEGSNSNLFITGKAGTGKSTLLRHFRATTYKNVAVIAPTGVAALNVKGQTIHSFFRFRPDITPDTVRRLSRFGSAMYRKIDTIVIDEISMVRADLLDCIDRFMRMNGRDVSRPFGGCQMVMIGDLYQLPPVVTRDETEIFNSHYKSPYFFDSQVFSELDVKFIELTKHYRQTEDAFISLLNAIRSNKITQTQIDAINSRYNPGALPDDKSYVTLTTTNASADRLNGERLSQIHDKEYVYNASFAGEFDKRVLPADEVLHIKKGAQVMLLNNDSDGRWVNGTIGTVSSIGDSDDGNDTVYVELPDRRGVAIEPHTWEIFKFSLDDAHGKLVAKRTGSFSQYPLTLAWAVTIHKSQGKTFDRVIIDIGHGTFAHGQLYVAMSRCTTLDGIILRKKVEQKHILMDERIVEFMSKCERLDAQRVSAAEPVAHGLNDSLH